MGCASSKTEKNEALRLCKERRRFVKQAIDSRYGLAAAHVSYTESLRNIGIALRRFAEAEALIESSLSMSATELDKTPSQSSYPSPSPSHNAEVSDSPMHNESPLSPPVSRLSYMRSGATAAVTVSVNPPKNGYMDDESTSFSMPPPPPPPPEAWKRVQGKEVGLDGTDELHEISTRPGWEHKTPEGSDCNDQMEESNGHSINSGGTDGIRKTIDYEVKHQGANAKGSAETMSRKHILDQSGSKRERALVEKDVSAEREDPSEFITHRAKDFLSSIKDIEHRFFRASESGKEVSRMLETNKIGMGIVMPKLYVLSQIILVGRSSASRLFGAFQLVCCQEKSALVSHGKFDLYMSVKYGSQSINMQYLYRTSTTWTKIITWNRSTSSRSSSSKNPLTTAATKEDNDDSGSDFVEEFCMIAGSHSSTLERLYAWERKLYDEVKASESIRKEYDRKCDKLRHQVAKDLSSQVIDKTRAVVKDLHSRLRVAIHAVDSISKRIEKMRDEELQPQLAELIQGLIRMWKAMLECHHAQYITISLAYHARSSTGTPRGDPHRQIMAQLQSEIEYFGLSFADWINSHTSYVEALNGWLQNCILLPQEPGAKGLPADELSDAIKQFISDLHQLLRQTEEQQKKEKPFDSNTNGESESKDDEKTEDKSLNLGCIHTSLAKVLERLTKFSEASLKMYEDVRQKSEAARIAYSTGRPSRPEGYVIKV
ncbi:Nitrate regulatory gene2 protein [Vitis vinifera]|uniref:Nitrate regulatory gene2 protein n=1 Tax=Vitis vinifera TaxID=29760 RepID=A0A438FC03_VITVI|nr:Nitrate regulatory gene2 protein [Vitis vinifera]